MCVCECVYLWGLTRTCKSPSPSALPRSSAAMRKAITSSCFIRGLGGEGGVNLGLTSSCLSGFGGGGVP